MSEIFDAVEIFAYAESDGAPFVPSWAGWEAVPDAGGVKEAPTNVENAGAAAFDQRIAEETRRSFEAGRTRGIEEGRAAERAAHAAATSAVREEQIRQAAGLVSQFQSRSDQYFQAVEQEVVKLALAVAGRILRRESVTDPLLLMSSVRVALGQIAASTHVRLCVPPDDLELWTEAIALLPNLKTKPRVIAGEGMRVGDCIIETELGNANLGIPHQLAEIERTMLQEHSLTESSDHAQPNRLKGAR